MFSMVFSCPVEEPSKYQLRSAPARTGSAYYLTWINDNVCIPISSSDQGGNNDRCGCERVERVRVGSHRLLRLLQRVRGQGERRQWRGYRYRGGSRESRQPRSYLRQGQGSHPGFVRSGSSAVAHAAKEPSKGNRRRSALGADLMGGRARGPYRQTVRGQAQRSKKTSDCAF